MATTGHESEAINVQGLKASLQQFKDDFVVYPVDLESMTVSTTFRKGSIVSLDGKVYCAKDDTSNFPFPLVIDSNNNFCIHTNNGATAFVVSSTTLDSDWEVYMDCSNEYEFSNVVRSGFTLTEDDVNGIDTLAAVGTATIVMDDTNGLDILNF